ncbi:uncharacterized protein LOC130443346 [Diorhabda sublineata]|uniref:uncharacterized protein LOC130443346 n=1 Tax=Diorhabda sublineata TaxID=1163346 RepID=UPI0024E15667|nr:uncharacterized protein LOC130443346 [Diorhabda sublineata]
MAAVLLRRGRPKKKPFPSDHPEGKQDRIPKNTITSFIDRGSGDLKHRHSLERSETRSLVPNINKLPKGYGNFHSAASTIPSENLVLLYSKPREPDFVFSEPISSNDFLFPSKKKTRAQALDVESEHRMSKLNSRDTQIESGTFPFKLTPSGNLKVDSSQVVFSSNKLSVLVADPKLTKVSVHPKSMNCCNKSKMAQDTDASKTSAMDSIISQAGFSSINTFLGPTPIRSGNKEASEYESKQTSEILDPELNLGRLGYNGTDDINWQTVALPEKKNLYLELYSRITNYTNADCKVYIDNEEFNCHLIVLQCYSELFDAYIAVKKVELPSDKCSAASFAFIYEWMITGEPSYKDLSRENVLDIFISAKYLKIKDLVEQCWAFIDNMDVFSEDTAFLLYMDSKEKNLPEVRELMMPRIQGFFLMLVSSQNWLELEVEDVKNFLNSNYICVNCEMEVFMSAVRWLKHDWANRDHYKYDVLECVRFGNIAPWQLVDIKRNPENPDFLELAKDPRICKMIDDGLAYVIIKYWYGQENDDFQHWNTVLGLHEPPNRNWSGADKTYFTYREFLIYLDQYRRNQLIDKSKPKFATEKEANGGKKVINQDGKISPRIPTMDEFLSKKKETYSTPTCKYGFKTKQFTGKPSFTRSQAAVIIQKAYRRYKKSHLKKKLHFSKKRSNRDATNTNRGVLKMFCMPKNPFNKQNNVNRNGSKRNLLETGSLFHKIRDTVLIFGGTDTHNPCGFGRNTGKDIYRYMPLGNCWEFVGELPEPRHHHCTEFFKGRIFLVGGNNPSVTINRDAEVSSFVWSFDPVTRKWYQELPLLEARKNFGLVSCNQYLYAIGGQGNHYRALDSVERFDLEKNIWENVCSMKTARTGFGYTRYGHCIWVAGGLTDKNSTIDILDSIESYDYKSDQWTEIKYSLRVPRCFFSLCVLSEKLYIIGGASKTASDLSGNDTSSIGSIEYWDNKKFEWKKLNDLNIPRHGHAVSYLGTQLLIVGGVATKYGRALSNTECFCSQRETWVRGLACLPTPLSGHSMVTLPPASLLLG